jgi:hypothetical protein
MVTVRENEARMDSREDDPGQMGPDSAGQSGDGQGLSPIADAATESVEELIDTGQAYEADVVTGIEDAADHPERPVHTHEVLRPTGWGVSRLAEPAPAEVA